MVLVFAFDFFHGRVPCHGHAARANYRIEIDMRSALKNVFGKELAVDLYAKLLRHLGNLDSFFGSTARRDKTESSEISDKEDQCVGKCSLEHGNYRKENVTRVNSKNHKAPSVWLQRMDDRSEREC